VGSTGQREGICERAVNTDRKGPPGSGGEWARARRGRCRQAWPTGQREVERERERACADAGSRWQVGPTYQATWARARAAWLGRVGPAGLKSPFLFPGNF
jgi:hypothetical protein